MCLGLPGRVIEINGKSCKIEVMGAEREISLEFLEGIKIGDYVLVHAGCAMQKLDEEEACRTLELFKELKETMNE